MKSQPHCQNDKRQRVVSPPQRHKDAQLNLNHKETPNPRLASDDEGLAQYLRHKKKVFAEIYHVEQKYISL